jgi:hypothetical protein
MAYGELKVDSITFTDNGTDTTVSVSGLVQNPTFSGNITVTGTISGSVVQGGVTVSGATVTGSAGEFDTITGNTAGFTTITGTTVTGSTANFVSGTFTTQVSGATVTGNLAQFTTITGGTAGFTTVTGTTVTGSTGQFGTVTGNTAGFTTVTGTTVTGSTGQFGTVTGNTAGFTTVTGTTVTGTTASFTSGVFTNISGGTHTITSGVFDDGTAAAPSITFTGDLDTGIYSPGANQVAISTNGTGRLFVDASGNVSLGTSSPQERLDVAGVGASFLRWEHDGASGSYGTSGGVLRIGPYFAATDRELALFVDNSNAAWITTGTTNQAINIGTNKTSRIYIDTVGRVGVGTTSPAVDFDVAGKIRTSTGILFGSDTAAANTLDDYEEGTWTPAFSFATPGDLAVTYSSQTGNYRIVGKLCIATFTLEFTPTYTTSSGTARVTGLPLSTGNYLTTPASVDRFSGFTLTAGFDNMWLRKNTSQTYVELYSMGRSGSASMGTSEVVSGSAKILNGTIIYNL